MFVIKAEVTDPDARTFVFAAQKTMYGGKRIAAGDTVYVFASENEGGEGLVARGIVTAAAALPKTPGVTRETPRVSVEIRRTARARRPLGRSALRRYDAFDDGRPGSELNFKLYRQATDKIVAISDETAAFLATYF